MRWAGCSLLAGGGTNCTRNISSNLLKTEILLLDLSTCSLVFVSEHIYLLQWHGFCFGDMLIKLLLTKIIDNYFLTIS